MLHINENIEKHISKRIFQALFTMKFQQYKEKNYHNILWCTPILSKNYLIYGTKIFLLSISPKGIIKTF